MVARGLMIVLSSTLIAPAGTITENGWLLSPWPLPLESKEEDEESLAGEGTAALAARSVSRAADRRTTLMPPGRLGHSARPARIGDLVRTYFDNLPHHFPNGLGVPLLC